MTPFPAINAFVNSDGRLTTAGLTWLAKLIEELRAKDETIAALEARVAALEP